MRLKFLKKNPHRAGSPLTKNWRELEKVTAKEWMTKYAGAFAYKTMWEPMMIGKFGSEYADRVSMAWLWARIYSRTTSLGTFDGGMQDLYDIFAAKLQDAGVKIRFGTKVDTIEQDGSGKFRLSGEKEQWTDIGKVIVTTSPQSMLGLCDALPEDYKSQLAALQHLDSSPYDS